jgi:hypothetical protein
LYSANRKTVVLELRIADGQLGRTVEPEDFLFNDEIVRAARAV